jgi:phosphoribosyl 1,2-cyclic phosphate phosphodiesterase
MKIRFLGTGTSHGIPVIGCDCPVCHSADPRNRRRRCSLYVQAGGNCLLFDTPPDLREQALTFGVRRVDRVFITHGHADHIFGFDDIRRYAEMQRAHIPVHAAPDTLELLRSKFDYVDKPSHSFGGVPRVRFESMTAPVSCGGGVSVTPVPVEHGAERIYGYRVDAPGGSVAYVPDCSVIPEDSFAKLAGLDVMILDALRPEPHPTHFSLSQSVEALLRIRARTAFVTHLTHGLEHAATQALLPENMQVPFDGLELDVNRL